MPQDAFTLRYLCEELDEIFSGGKINRIVQPDGDRVIMTVFTGKSTEKLLVDVNPAAPRIGVTREEAESPLTAPNFCMLLRKHLLSATVDGIKLIGFDRIVKISLTTSGELVDAVKKDLYIELMGRYSNVILTENGKILGGNRGINMFDNGVRPLIVGRDYVFPPVGEKRLPGDASLIGIFCENGEDGIADCVVKNVQGIAVSTACDVAGLFKEREIKFSGEAFFRFMNDYLYSKEKSPCVTFSGGEAKDVFVRPYLSAKGDKVFFNRLWEAEERYFAERERAKKFSAKKERLNAAVNSALKKANKRLAAILAKERDASDAEDNRIKGELILANIYKIRAGDETLSADNYYDGTTVTIALDPRLSPSRNAENYYKRYNKKKRTLVALSPQKAAAESEIEYLSGVSDEIALAEDIDDLFSVQRELEAAKILTEKRRPTNKKEKETFCREYEIFGFKLRVGRNNTENDRLTFSAAPCDLWIHAKNYHSSHAILYTEGKKVPDEVITLAAETAAYYSKGRDGGKTEMAITERKNVKKPSGAKPGFVTYSDYSSVTVNPLKHAEFLKSGSNG